MPRPTSAAESQALWSGAKEVVGAAPRSSHVPVTVPEQPSIEAATMVTMLPSYGPFRILALCAGILRRLF